MVTRFFGVFGAVLLALAGCAPASPAAPAPGPVAPAQAPASAAPKTLTIGQQTPREGFAPWFIAGPPGPLQWEELHTNFLVSADAFGKIEPWLAAGLPSFQDGTVEILPDGRMRTVWKVRPNIKWHDGSAFTTEDVAFGWQVAMHPEIPVSRSPNLRAIQSIETPDPHTAVIIYRSTLYKALELGYRDLWPLPRRLLAEAFEGPKEAFISLPFWSTDYVHTGPFRVTEFMPGEKATLERFDDYFLGRPKLDRIIVRMIPDNNTVMSNLLAGAVDIAGELPTELSVRLRDQWQQGGGGFVLSRQAFWRVISVQFHPEWGGPPELQQDVRVRRGLAHAIDRDAIRGAVFPGFPDTEGDTFMLKGDLRAPVVGAPFAPYRYDRPAAARELAEAGWRPAPDGRLLNRAGEQVRLQLRAPTSDMDTELAVVARNWRELGMEVAEEVTPAALRRDNEHNVKFPGMEITSQGAGEGIFRRFDSRLRPTPQNRYTGTNAGSYVSPALDALIDRLSVTIDDREAAVLLREMGEIIAADLPALPLYFVIRTVVALQHVRGLDDIHGAPGRIGTTSKNAYLWDRG